MAQLVELLNEDCGKKILEIKDILDEQNALDECGIEELIIQNVRNMNVTFNEKLKLMLYRSLVNCLHRTNKKNIHELCKCITSPSTAIGFQGINIITEYAEIEGRIITLKLLHAIYV